MRRQVAPDPTGCLSRQVFLPKCQPLDLDTSWLLFYYYDLTAAISPGAGRQTGGGGE